MGTLWKIFVGIVIGFIAAALLVAYFPAIVTISAASVERATQDCSNHSGLSELHKGRTLTIVCKDSAHITYPK